MLRDKFDYVHFLEEYVDVCLALGFLKQIVGIEDEEIKAGCTVKCNRLENILKYGKYT